MDPALFTHRVSYWWVDLLDHTGALKGRLDGVTAGRIEHNAHRAVHGGGSLTLVERPARPGWVSAADVDWLSDRVRIWWQVRGVDPWPLGTFLLDRNVRALDPTGATRSVDLLDPLTVLDQWGLPTTTLPAGVLATDVARSMILAAGEDQMSITPSTQGLPTALTWEGDKATRLRVVNDVLDSAGYRGLAVDGLGAFLVQPYVRPQDRAPAVAFVEGVSAIHSPRWQREQDTHDVPNQVIARARAADHDDPDMEVVVDLPADNPYSAARTGRVKTDWIDEEATSVEALRVIAQRKLIDAASPTATLTITHAPLPLRVNDVATFRSQGHEARCVVTQTSLDLSATSMQSTRLREVVAL